MSEKRRIVINTLANGVAQFAAMITALVFMPFLVKGFGATNFGLYLITSSISGYAGLLDLGVGASLVKMTAEAAASGDKKTLRRTVSSAFAFYIVIGIVAAGVLAVLALNTQSIFRVSPDGARLLRNLLLVASAWSLVSWPAVTFNAVLQGFQKYTQTSRIALAGVLGNVAVTVAVLIVRQGPLALLAGTYAVAFITVIAQYVLARRELGADVPLTPVGASREGFRSLYTLAWAVFLIQICSVIVYQQTDRLVLGVFIGATAVALYEAAGKFQGLVSQLTVFTVSAVMPMASHLDAQGRQESLRNLFLRGTKYSLMLVSPAVVVLVVVARPLLNSWLGPAFAAQSLAAQLLISHQVLTSGVAVGDSMLTGLGQLPKRVPYAIGVAALNLAISLALVRRLGILGVVLGTMIPYFVDYPFHMRLILRGLDVPMGRWIRETVLPVYPLLVVPGVIAWAMLRTPLAGSLLGIAAIAVVSVGAYWVAILLFGFTASERAELASGLRALASRLRGV